MNTSMSINGADFTCKENAQKQASKTLGSGMALQAIKIQLNNVESLEIIQES